MRDPIDIVRERHAWYTKHVPVDIIQNAKLEDLHKTLELLAEVRKPYYRIWHYLRMKWETGFSSKQLAELKQNFKTIKENEDNIDSTIEYRLSKMYISDNDTRFTV